MYDFEVLPHIVNACILTSAFSAGNSLLFCSSRVLYGLALRGQAPRFLTYCTKSGLPLYAVLTSAAFSLLSFLSVSSGSDQAFVWVLSTFSFISHELTSVFTSWLVGLSTTGGYTSWFVMNVSYIYFREFSADTHCPNLWLNIFSQVAGWLPNNTTSPRAPITTDCSLSLRTGVQDGLYFLPCSPGSKSSGNLMGRPSW